jgi:hypothetical protein
VDVATAPPLNRGVTISSANRSLSGLAENLSIRYGLGTGADDLPIQDFEGMLGRSI